MNIYVNPFVAGIVATILAEFILLIVIAVVKGRKK